MRLTLLAMAAAVSGCSPDAVGFAEWHSEKRATDLIVEEALAADPPDYPRAITAIERSGRPRGVMALEAGDLIVAGHREEQRERRPEAPLEQGFSLLERAASGHGEASDIARQHLRLWFERGVGSGGSQALAPHPHLARCWAAVEARAERPATCVRMRSGASAVASPHSH